MTKPEAAAWLQNFIDRYNKQDHACTAHPRLLELRVPRKQFVPHDYGNGGWWRDKNGDCESPIVEAKDAAAAVEVLKHQYEIDTPEDELQQLDIIEWEEVRGVFFTDDGVTRHLNMNAHNYRDGVRKFTEHAFRNPEIKELLEACAAIVDKRIEP